MEKWEKERKRDSKEKFSQCSSTCMSLCELKVKSWFKCRHLTHCTLVMGMAPKSKKRTKTHQFVCLTLKEIITAYFILKAIFFNGHILV